jgi:hypothetical protein
MKKKYFLVLAVAVAAGFGSMGVAHAGAYAGAVGASGVCPNVMGTDGPQGTGSGSATDCNLIFTFNADGSVTTSGPGGAYESNDDALIGVINNTSHLIDSFNLTQTGVDIFGFESDGIDTYINNTSANGGQGYATQDWYALLAGNPDTSGYGGPAAYFTGINSTFDSGTVNFIGGIASGHSNFFSLEDAASLSAPPTITQSSVPEPSSIALLGLALSTLAFARRRKSQD